MGIIATLSALGIATRIRDEFFPQVSKYRIVQILPANWTWQIWVLLVLAVVFIAFVEGAFRQHLQYVDGGGPLLDATGRHIDKKSEAVAPVTRHVAGLVILVIISIWAYSSRRSLLHLPPLHRSHSGLSPKAKPVV